jgi:hypothetical protein
MKITFIASAFALLALGACETVATTSAPMEAVSTNTTQIMTLPQFSQLIVGKQLRHAESGLVFTVNSDGTLSGDYSGTALKGTWHWEDRYWCRTLTTVRPGTDCQAWEITGNAVTVTRQRGTAGTATYLIE